MHVCMYVYMYVCVTAFICVWLCYMYIHIYIYNYMGQRNMLLKGQSDRLSFPVCNKLKHVLGNLWQCRRSHLCRYHLSHSTIKRPGAFTKIRSNIAECFESMGFHHYAQPFSNVRRGDDFGPRSVPTRFFRSCGLEWDRWRLPFSHGTPNHPSHGWPWLSIG